MLKDEFIAACLKVDTDRPYITRNGLPVKLHAVVPLNGHDDCVTFPLKGTIFNPLRPRWKKNMIWRLDGRASVFMPLDDDIPELEPK